MIALHGIHQQLELFGLEARRAEASGDQRQIARLEAASRAMLENFKDADSIAWTHAAFAQVGLPHSRPASDAAPWHRANGRLHLLVEPGRIIDHGEPRLVGVPYGATARLILIYVQSHAGRDGIVPLGRSLSAWLGKLGLQVTGGKKGTITAVREQMLRFARSRMSLHWTDATGTSARIVDQLPVDGMTLWHNVDPHLRDWHEALHLTQPFLEALREHGMPLADHAIRYLRGTPLGLDIYTWLAHRLPRVTKREAGRLLDWPALAQQFGAHYARPDHLGGRIRALLPDVLAVYPGARVEANSGGVRLWPSPPAVPRRERSR